LLPNMKVVDIKFGKSDALFYGSIRKLYCSIPIDFPIYGSAGYIGSIHSLQSRYCQNYTQSGRCKSNSPCVLTKNVYPKLTTTITGAVSCGGLLLSGMKIVDINSSSPTTYTTDSSGGFLITLKLTSQYTADLVISDPNAVYNNDTVTVTVNPVMQRYFQ